MSNNSQTTLRDSLEVPPHWHTKLYNANLDGAKSKHSVFPIEDGCFRDICYASPAHGLPASRNIDCRISTRDNIEYGIATFEDLDLYTSYARGMLGGIPLPARHRSGFTSQQLTTFNFEKTEPQNNAVSYLGCSTLRLRRYFLRGQRETSETNKIRPSLIPSSGSSSRTRWRLYLPYL